MALKILTIIDAPGRRAVTLRERPRWIARFFILAGLYVALGIFGSAHRAEITAGNLPPPVSAGERAAAGELLTGRLTIDSLFLPVRLFVGWSAFALLLYFTCRIWSTRRPTRYVHLLAAEVYSEAAMFLGNLAALIAVTWDTGASPPWIPGGLDSILPAGDFTLRYVLNSVNIFSALYVALLVVMVSALVRISRGKAFISVLVAWGIQIFVNAAIIHILIRDFRFGL